MADPLADGGGHRYVTIDVLAIALHVSRGRARRIARSEQIRTAGTRPQQYLFEDVVRVHRARKTKAQP